MAIYSVVVAPFLVVESDWASTNIRTHAFLALLAKPKHRLDKIHATNQICHGTDREGVAKTVTKATKRTSAFANQPRNRPAPKLKPVQTTVCLASATRIHTANRTRTGDYLTKLPLKSLISIHTSPKGGDSWPPGMPSQSWNFNPHLPEGEVTVLRHSRPHRMHISIHTSPPPRREATISWRHGSGSA